jgi:hypothetical protein
MSKSQAEAQSVLASAFIAHSGEVEPEEFLASVVLCVADEIELLATALESDEGSRESAVRCLRRSADRLRLALRFPARMTISASTTEDQGQSRAESLSDTNTGASTE